MGGYSLQKLTGFQEPESKFPEYSPERRSARPTAGNAGVQIIL